MELVLFLHVLGAIVLIGTGVGIAFFMAVSTLKGTPDQVAHVAGIVVIADFVFTATAALAQPVTGVMLALSRGWPLTTGWLAWSLVLYVVIGLCWLPVVAIQMRLHRLARQAAASGTGLGADFRRLFRLWLALGVPAFVSILAILWLMLMKP